MKKMFEHNGVRATLEQPDPVPMPEGNVTLTVTLSVAKALLALVIPGISTQVAYIEAKVGKAEAAFVRTLEDPFYNIYFVLDDVLQAVHQRQF